MHIYSVICDHYFVTRYVSPYLEYMPLFLAPIFVLCNFFYNEMNFLSYFANCLSLFLSLLTLMNIFQDNSQTENLFLSWSLKSLSGISTVKIFLTVPLVTGGGGYQYNFNKLGYSMTRIENIWYIKPGSSMNSLISYSTNFSSWRLVYRGHIGPEN